MSEKKRDIFLLDTTVLLYDPNCIYHYPNARVMIPISVIEEIDHFKKELSETGRNARMLVQMLDEIRVSGSLIEGVLLKNNTLLTVFSPTSERYSLPSFLDSHKTSNKVLAAALSIRGENNGSLYLVTNDINLRIRCSAMGIRVGSHEEVTLKPADIYEGMSELNLDKAEFDQIKEGLPVTHEATLFSNEVVKIRAQGKEETLVCRYLFEEKKLYPVNEFPKGVWNVFPRSLEQKAALDFLMDPKIQIVILSGKSGTGKTLLALAAGLELMLSNDLYLKMLVSRPIYPMGRDLGYLPGDVKEKLAPWMQPIFDNLEYLSAGSRTSDRKMSGYHQLLEKGLIEIEPLTYIRGRSIPNRFMIIDEAQNLTPHEIKTIITRVGEGTKMVLTGDPFQIDNPYINTTTNGLSYVIDKMKPYPLAAHVYFVKGERSPLAELAANIL